MQAVKKIDGIKLSVQDNGLGIAKKHLNKIFDMYYSINNKVGTGLGLYIVKNIVDDLNGKIKVTSEINKGTTFEIELPNFIIKSI